jgi:hypothetical protein
MVEVEERLAVENTVRLVNGYDRHKIPEVFLFRRFTIEDVRALATSTQRLFWFESKQGVARQCRKASKLKTWKKDPQRFECSFKYGMYECTRLTTQDMLKNLLVFIVKV